MTITAAPECEDQLARAQALDVTRSFIVQAPAGSGKTELLTRRLLALLAVVDEPEQVLAITFTRAATAEMRHRVLIQIQAAHRRLADALPEAHAALHNSAARGWQLLERPQRLNIQTIDSLCLQIAHEMPLLARIGANLSPVDNATPLYLAAAQRTLDQLGGGDSRLHEAVAALLLLRDNNLADCERLLAQMLARRDQWAHAFAFHGETDWERVRRELEEPFQREISRGVARAHAALSRHPHLVEWAARPAEVLLWERRCKLGLKVADWLPRASESVGRVHCALEVSVRPPADEQRSMAEECKC